MKLITLSLIFVFFFVSFFSYAQRDTKDKDCRTLSLVQDVFYNTNPEQICELDISLEASKDRFSGNEERIDTATVATWQNLKSISVKGDRYETLKSAISFFDKVQTPLSKLPNFGVLNLQYIDIDTVTNSIFGLQNLHSIQLSSVDVYQPTLLFSKLYALPNLSCLSLIDINLHPDSVSFLSVIEPLISLKKLKELDISNNDFEEYPTFVNQLTKLEKLNINNTSVKEIPKSIHKLAHLKELNIINNSLQVFPNTLLSLQNLEVLSFRDNNLESLPTDISKLEKLKSLDLDFNNFTEFPISLLKNKNLEILSLSENQLKSLPKKIKRLKHLKTLNLTGNPLAKLPTYLSELSSLKRLEIGNTKLKELHESIGKMTELEYLDISDNELTRLPLSISNLKNLETLFITGNQLEAYPTELNGLVELKNLSLKLENELSEDIGNLSNLEHLRLEIKAKQLPKALCRLEKLTDLSIIGAGLEVLDKEIGNLTKLQYLYLGSNKLKEIPATIENLKNLYELDLNNNELTRLPESIKVLHNLKFLNLIGNNFSEEERQKIFDWLPNTQVIFDDSDDWDVDRFWGSSWENNGGGW